MRTNLVRRMVPAIHRTTSDGSSRQRNQADRKPAGKHVLCKKASQRALPSARGIEPLDGIAVDPPGELRDERACVGGIGPVGGPGHE